jgi:hypothetical protein
VIVAAAVAAIVGLVLPVSRPVAPVAPVAAAMAAEVPEGPLPKLDLSGLDRAQLNAACEGCHVEEAAEWRDSPHHTAYSDPVFARSFAREPRATCQGCHAPEADPTRPPPSWAAEQGVTCVTCHLDEDDRIMATRDADLDASPHELRPTGQFEGDAACARCHEFDFPRTPRDRDPGPMQLTITEHARSEYADIACADCHMGPEGPDEHAGHAFSVTRNEALLRDAIAVEVDRTADGRMVFDLTPIGVGHSFPTGDLFRRLELRAEAVDDEGRVVGTAFRYLARHFPPPKWDRDHTRRADVVDDRLRGPATIELELPAVAAPHAVRWSVRYQRVDQRFARAPETSTLSGETVLAEGWT